MPGKVFIDSNILVYAALYSGSDSRKHWKALEILEDQNFFLSISSQVVNEFYAVMLKQKIGEAEIREKALEILDEMEVVPITAKIIRSAWELKDKYHLSYWDSLIVAAALESGSSILYSEDMRDGLVIEKTLTIKNPFKQ